MLLKLSKAEAALLHGRLLSDLEHAFGRPMRQSEANALVKLIKRVGRYEVHARLKAYVEAVRAGIAKPVTCGQWMKHHGLLWEVQHAA